MDIIKTGNLTKKFANLTAVDNVTFSVKKGEIFGFLGPNGAGKTTTIKMLLGLVFPTSGEFTIFGEKLSVDMKKKIGYLPEDPSFPPYFTAQEALSYYADLYELKKEEKEDKIKELLELVSLDKYQPKKITQFSRGMKQRLGLAQALLADPDLVIFDDQNISPDKNLQELGG